MAKILIAVFSFFFTTSLYTLSFTNTSGTVVSFSSMQGKKILLVNIATGSAKVNQLSQLEQLRQAYGDSLVIVAFPSNSFGHEPKTNAEIKALCESTYNTHFFIAQKASVTGTDKQPLYQWLTNQAENGVMGGEIKGDFQKYLVDKNGQLIGVFAGNVSPLDPQITNAVTGAQ